MKEQIIRFIEQYVSDYQDRPDIATQYGQPLVGFADARHPYIQNLPCLIGPSHELPQNILADARTIIAYYVPFTRTLAKTNRQEPELASPQWARAYEETNAMFGELNQALIDLIHAKAESPARISDTARRDSTGIAGALRPDDSSVGEPQACITPKATTFDQQRLVSDWSQRHIAYAAGLGTFGLNNMLLTRHGCCGRFSTVITNLDLETDSPVAEEYCLYKKNGSCGACVKHCPTGALTTEGYDRFRCYALCQENAKIYTDFGSSYTNEDGTGANSVGSEVCGKCITGSPCAFWNIKD